MIRLPRRRWLLVPLVLFAVVFGLCVAFGRPMYVTQAQIDKVKEGMTLAEVQLLLEEEATHIQHKSFDGKTSYDAYWWQSWTGEVLVMMSPNDRVVQVQHVEFDSRWRMWTGRLRRKFGG